MDVSGWAGDSGGLGDICGRGLFAINVSECNVIPPVPALAIAYVESGVTVGEYNSDEGDGTPSAGDVVELDRYPLNFNPSTPEDCGVFEGSTRGEVVEVQLGPEGYYVGVVTSMGHRVGWREDPGREGVTVYDRNGGPVEQLEFVARDRRLGNLPGGVDKRCAGRNSGHQHSLPEMEEKRWGRRAPRVIAAREEALHYDYIGHFATIGG